jgi:ZIP family zinc transporter
LGLEAELSFAETVLLGALAGLTIFLGLPVGRLQLLSSRTRVALAMFSVGILVFLLVDVLAHGFEISGEAVTAYDDGTGSFAHAAVLALLLVGGFALGSAGLGILERRLRPSAPVRPPIAGGATDVLTAEEHHRLVTQRAAARAQALQTGLIIATAIGLHNFAEGLAIGVSARAGEIGLATVLIIGFALHNATEGFGIIGPLGDIKPSWRWLALAGLIGGGPTFLGSIVGYNVTSEPLELLFYAVAGGAILYVIGEIGHGMRRYGHRELGLVLLACGFAAGALTDLVVAYGGG